MQLHAVPQAALSCGVCCMHHEASCCLLQPGALGDPHPCPLQVPSSIAKGALDWLVGSKAQPASRRED